MPNIISIARLKVPVHIGVPDEERAQSQSIEISLNLVPRLPLFATKDQIENTINYYEVAQTVTKVAQERPRKLIETLNEDILRMILTKYPVKSATIKTFKFILPNATHVAIEMTMSKDILA